MKLSYAAVPLLAFAGGVLARNCTPGLNYCTQTLLKIGNYQPQIDLALADAGFSNAGGQSLFACTGGANGAIVFIRHCLGSCRDGGIGRSDYCS